MSGQRAGKRGQIMRVSKFAVTQTCVGWLTLTPSATRQTRGDFSLTMETVQIGHHRTKEFLP